MNKTLRNLGLKRNNLNHNDILNLCKGLRKNSRLNRLDLSCNSFEDEDILALCDALENKHSGIHSLKFSSLSDSAIETFCKMVQNTSLHYIKISITRIVDTRFNKNGTKDINCYDNCIDMLLPLNRFLAENRERDHRQVRWALVLLSFLTDPKEVRGTFPYLPRDLVKLIVTHCLSSGYDHEYKHYVVNKLSASVETIILQRNLKAPQPLAHLIQLGIGATQPAQIAVQQPPEPSQVNANTSPSQLK